MQPTNPLLLCLSDDLFIIPRLEDAAHELGFRFKLVAKAEEINAKGDPVPRAIPLTEPLEGPEAEMMRFFSHEQPALVLVDTTCQSIPWLRWIHILKTSAATRRIPIIAFGPHVEKDLLQRARQEGADASISRGRLQSSLATVIQQWARTHDRADIQEACAKPLSSRAKQGLQLLNSGEYYEAHEYLEEAWMDEPGPEGFLSRAILQVAVSYLHLMRGNYQGALKMLLRVKQWLNPLPDTCRGLDIAILRQDLQALEEHLLNVGPEGLASLPENLIKPIPPAENPKPRSE
jgi:CheY-like chemotaxis protein